MPLITCIECQNKVSDLAKDCPHCGAPVFISLKTKCFECGNPLEHGETLCKNCGVDQSLNPEKGGEEKPIVEQAPPLEEKTETKPAEEKEKSEESKEQTQATNRQPKTSPRPTQTIPVSPKPKSGCLKPIVIGFLIVIVIGFVAFKFLPPEMKRELYEALGIENSDFVKNDLASYIHLEETRHKQNWLGTWVIDGMIYNLHESITVTEVDIKVKFSDYDEIYTINRYLKPGKVFKSPFEIRISSGHEDAYFEGCEVVDARE